MPRAWSFGQVGDADYVLDAAHESLYGVTTGGGFYVGGAVGVGLGIGSGSLGGGGGGEAGGVGCGTGSGSGWVTSGGGGSGGASCAVSPAGASVPAASEPCANTWVPPWRTTCVPFGARSNSQVASGRVTRTQPWLAGWAGTELEPWMAQPR